MRSCQVCVDRSTHQAIVASLATALLLLFCTSAWAWIVYKKTRALDIKNRWGLLERKYMLIPMYNKYSISRLADGSLSDSSSTAYLAHSGPFLVGGGHGRPQQRLQGGQHQQRYLPPIDTGHTKHERQRAYRSSFADPSEPIYTDPSLFER